MPLHYGVFQRERERERERERGRRGKSSMKRLRLGPSGHPSLRTIIAQWISARRHRNRSPADLINKGGCRSVVVIHQLIDPMARPRTPAFKRASAGLRGHRYGTAIGGARLSRVRLVMAVTAGPPATGRGRRCLGYRRRRSIRPELWSTSRCPGEIAAAAAHRKMAAAATSATRATRWSKLSPKISCSSSSIFYFLSHSSSSSSRSLDSSCFLSRSRSRSPPSCSSVPDHAPFL